MVTIFGVGFFVNTKLKQYHNFSGVSLQKPTKKIKANKLKSLNAGKKNLLSVVTEAS